MKLGQALRFTNNLFHLSECKRESIAVWRETKGFKAKKWCRLTKKLTKKLRESQQSLLFIQLAMWTNLFQPAAGKRLAVCNLPHALQIWGILRSVTLFDLSFSVSKPSLFLHLSPGRKSHFLWKRQITSESRFPPFPLQRYSSPLKSDVVLQPACLPLSAVFHCEQHRGSVVSVRNYAPGTVWLIVW